MYVGEYKDGKFNGRGKFVWHQGMVYEGEFMDGMRHGNGIWRESNSPDATTYEGEYYHDKKHGEGVYKWRSGSYYKGSFYNDQRHGYGEMYWIDGSSYKGQWEKGMQKDEGDVAYSSINQSEKKIQQHNNQQQIISDLSTYSHEDTYNDKPNTMSDRNHKL